MPNTNKEKTWEERFIKLLKDSFAWNHRYEYESNLYDELGEFDRKKLKTFISTLLKEQEEKHQGELDELALEIKEAMTRLE